MTVFDFLKSDKRYDGFAGVAVSAETRAVIGIASDAYECFAKCGKKYMDGPLSKSKDGFRKK